MAGEKAIRKKSSPGWQYGCYSLLVPAWHVHWGTDGAGGHGMGRGLIHRR
jgi:hypothetical protein